MPDIIVNIKTEKEFNRLIKRLNSLGYHKGQKGDLERLMGNFDDYNYDLCLRLSGTMVNHDQVDFYKRNYTEVKILSVDEYYYIHDKEYVSRNLNKLMINAIKTIMERRNNGN